MLVGNHFPYGEAHMNAHHVESLESRRLFAVTASFNPAGGGVLAVTGDDANNTITLSRNVAGQLFVNGGAVAISGSTTPTVANTGTIKVFARGGHDGVTLDESNGSPPKAHLFGDAGNDILTGGSGNDSLFGAAGGDQLFGVGGNDTMFGSADGDRLVG